MLPLQWFARSPLSLFHTFLPERFLRGHDPLSGVRPGQWLGGGTIEQRKHAADSHVPDVDNRNRFTADTETKERGGKGREGDINIFGGEVLKG